jgi:hypothetical protein
VEIAAQAPAPQAENATLGILVNPQATEDLPLNGRNVQALTLLVPGSNAGLPNGLPSGNRPDGRRPTSSVSINGQQPTANGFLFDGMDDNERFTGTIIVKPSVVSNK